MRIFLAILLTFPLAGLALDRDDYAPLERALVRGVGHAMPAGELYNLRRSAFALPDLPESGLDHYFSSSYRQSTAAFTVQSDAELASALQIAATNAQQYGVSGKAPDIALAALVFSTAGIGFRDSLLLEQGWQHLLSLPPPPSSGGFARNDASGSWGDLLAGSEALANAALAYTILRSQRPEPERQTIAQTLANAAFRLRNGIEFIGPNNHALSTGANLATTLLLLSPDDFPCGKRTRIELWRIAERYLQIGLAQIGQDGVYREGPGYAQVILRNLTRFALLMQLHSNENLLNHPLLHRLATTTSELTRNNGAPLPLDDAFPRGGNLWRQVASLLPNEPQIAQFALLPPSGNAAVEGLFEAVWFPPKKVSTTQTPRKLSKLYRDGGIGILRGFSESPVVITLSGEPRNRWTGRHEQIDPENLLCEVGSQMRITSGGYGPQGVYDRDRRYWISGESQSAFLVDGQPLHEFYDSGENENSPQWEGTSWDDANLLAHTSWKQDGVWLSRIMLTLGDVVAIVDRIDSTEQSYDEIPEVEMQFSLSGTVVTSAVGEWMVSDRNGENPLRIVTIPSTSGTVRKGFATGIVDPPDEVMQLRLPLEKIRITLLFPGSTMRIPLAKFTTNTEEKIEWRDVERTDWSLTLDKSSTEQTSVSLRGIRDDKELLYRCERNSATASDWIDCLQLSDGFGKAFFCENESSYRHFAMLPDSNRSQPSTYRGTPVDSRGVTTAMRFIDGWYVIGMPRFRLQEATIPTPPSQLSTLHTTRRDANIAEQIATWEPNRRAALEAEIADSILSQSTCGLDSLGLRNPVAMTMAAIDATTDGFAPGVFRVPFDADESWKEDDDTKNRLRLRGKWGGGLAVEQLQYERKNGGNGWAIERTAPHHQNERYEAEYWNKTSHIALDHSDGYASGMSFEQQYQFANLAHRVSRNANNRIEFQSHGAGLQHSYQITNMPDVRSISLQSAINKVNFRLPFGGEILQSRRQNRDWQTKGRGWLEWRAVSYGSVMRISGDNRYGKWNQFDWQWYGNPRHSMRLAVTQTEDAEGFLDWSSPFTLLRFNSDSSTVIRHDRFRVITRAEDRRGLWIATARLPLLERTTTRNVSQLAAYTERPLEIRYTGLEWRKTAFPVYYTLRSAASIDRIEQGVLAVGYWSDRGSIEWIGDYTRDVWKTGLTTSIPARSTYPLGEWRLAILRTEIVRPTPEVQITGSLELNRFDNRDTAFQQHIDYTISSTGDKTAEGGISFRW